MKMINKRKSPTILFQGGCDITALLFYINHKTIKIVDKNTVGTFGCSFSSYWVDQLKGMVIDHPFVKSDQYLDLSGIKTLVTSILLEPQEGIYVRKKDGALLRFGNPFLDARYDYAIKFPGFFKIYGEKPFAMLKDEYNYKGLISPSEVLENYKYIVSQPHFNCDLYILLGPTFASELGEKNIIYKVLDGIEWFRECNNLLITELPKIYKNVHFIDPKDFYFSSKKKKNYFYYNSPSIVHYTRKTYRNIAKFLSKRIKDVKFTYRYALKRKINKIFHTK